MLGPSLVEAPMLPTAYPVEERPHRVELAETHVSYLFMTGQHVYKVKKSVDFGFLDFTTLEKRATTVTRRCGSTCVCCPKSISGWWRSERDRRDILSKAPASQRAMAEPSLPGGWATPPSSTPPMPKRLATRGTPCGPPAGFPFIAAECVSPAEMVKRRLSRRLRRQRVPGDGRWETYDQQDQQRAAF